MNKKAKTKWDIELLEYTLAKFNKIRAWLVDNGQKSFNNKQIFKIPCRFCQYYFSSFYCEECPLRELPGTENIAIDETPCINNEMKDTYNYLDWGRDAFRLGPDCVSVNVKTQKDYDMVLIWLNWFINNCEKIMTRLEK